MKQIRIKLSVFFGRIATWQPKPFIGTSGGGPISGWFYCSLGGNGSFRRNWIGQKWSNFWWNLSDLFI